MCLLKLGLPDQELQFVGVVTVDLLKQLVRLLWIDFVETLRVLQEIVRTPLVVAL